MKLLLSITVVTIVIVVIYFITKKTKAVPATTRTFTSMQEAETIVQQLAESGYYKYADAKDIADLKKDLAQSIAGYWILSTLYFDNTLKPKDFRYYMFDGEAVFEQGGFTDMFNEMKGTFDKIGLEINITDHIEESDASKGLDHELTINGKRYIIFHNFKDYGWGEAAQKFAEMINDQLEIQNKDERLYLINGGNDGAAVFLNDRIFHIVDKLSTDKQWKPLNTNEWSKVFKVHPTGNI